MKIDTAIPPRYRRNLISRHWFVRNTKKRRLRFSKPPFQMGVSIELLNDGFFFFCRRPADLCICYESIMRSCA